MDLERRLKESKMKSIPDHNIPNGDLYEYIAGYIAAGYAPIPVKFKTKQPVGNKWPDLRIKLEEVPRRFPPPSNVGILLGDPSNGLIDIDLDCPEAIALAERFLPATSTFGRPSSPESHWLYHCPQVTTHQYQFNNTMLLEVRSTGAQTVFPPSIHESGEPITFEGDSITLDEALSIAPISQRDLNEQVALLAAATLLTRAWGKTPGIRHSTALALAGGLMHAGFSENKTARFISAITLAARDDEYDDRLKAVTTTYRAKDDKNTTGWPALSKLLGEDVIRTVREWLDIQDDQDIIGDHPSSITPAPQPTEPLITPAAKRLITRCMAGIVPKAPKWVWKHRIALGKICLLQGDPGRGKSLIALDIIGRVTTGRPWPVDNSPCPLGSAVLLAGEDDPEDALRPRLDAIGADCSLVSLIEGMTITNRAGEKHDRIALLDQDLDEIAAEVKALGHCLIVTIDPISEYLGNVDSYKNAEVRGLLRRVRELAGDLSVAVLLINHLNKHGTNAIARSMGSIAFVAASRSAFQASLDPQDETRQRHLLLPVKSNIGPSTTGFAYSIAVHNDVPQIIWEPALVDMSADDIFKVGEKEESALEKAVRFLEDILKDGPVEKPIIEMAAAKCGHSWPTVKRAKQIINVQTESKGFGVNKIARWFLPSNLDQKPPSPEFDPDWSKNEAKPKQDAASINMDQMIQIDDPDWGIQPPLIQIEDPPNSDQTTQIERPSNLDQPLSKPSIWITNPDHLIHIDQAGLQSQSNSKKPPIWIKSRIWGDFDPHWEKLAAKAPIEDQDPALDEKEEGDI